MEYLADTIRIARIREETTYGGRRVKLQARLGRAMLTIQIDVGVGDAVTPGPEWVELPPMLDLPVAKLRAYRPETSIAEKLETIARRGLLNSRLKDYFDILVLSTHVSFDLRSLAGAIRNTFERRETQIPTTLPEGLTQAYVKEPGRTLQWRSFLKKSGVADVPGELEFVVESIAMFLEPAIRAARVEETEQLRWPCGGPWQRQKEA